MKIGTWKICSCNTCPASEYHDDYIDGKTVFLIECGFDPAITQDLDTPEKVKLPRNCPLKDLHMRANR